MQLPGSDPLQLTPGHISAQEGVYGENEAVPDGLILQRLLQLCHWGALVFDWSLLGVSTLRHEWGNGTGDRRYTNGPAVLCAKEVLWQLRTSYQGGVRL